jgi:hypothetical protein
MALMNLWNFVSRLNSCFRSINTFLQVTSRTMYGDIYQALDVYKALHFTDSELNQHIDHAAQQPYLRNHDIFSCSRIPSSSRE